MDPSVAKAAGGFLFTIREDFSPVVFDRTYRQQILTFLKNYFFMFVHET